MPQLKKKVNLLNNNKLIWILFGQLYNSPKNSFINFYPDYKLTSHSYIFRTKIINHYNGNVEFINDKANLYQRFLRIINNKYSLINSKLQKIIHPIQDKNYLLDIDNFKYFLKVQRKDSKLYLQLARNQQIGTLVTKTFQTLTGGTIYYDHRNILKCNQVNQNISYLNRHNFSTKYKSLFSHRTRNRLN